MNRWHYVTVGDLVKQGAAEIKTGPFGTQLKASQYTATGCPVINVRNVGLGGLTEAKLEHVGPETAGRLSSHLLQKGDIVFGRKAAVDRHLFVTTQEGWMQGSDCLRLRLNDTAISPRFVSLYLRTPGHRQWILAQSSHGSTMATLNQGIIERISFAAPPLETQRRIASILCAYDDLIEVNRRRVAILQEMARGLFDEWFVRFRFPGHESVPMVDTAEGLLPEEWRIATLRQLCPGKSGIQTGPFGSQLHQEDYSDEGVPVVMPKNIAGLRVDTSGIARIPEALADSLGRHRMAAGDIVYGRRGDIGRRAFISKRENGYFCGTGCLRLRPDTDVVAPRYLFMALGTPGTEGAIRSRATGATMPNLSAGVMADVPVLLPAAVVQSSFVSLVEPMVDLLMNLEAANEELATSRDLLLPRLISGQLSVEAAERELEAAA